MFLAKKYSNALMQATVHEDEFAALCSDIPTELLDSWTAIIITWEVDRSHPNPYFNPSSGTLNLLIYSAPL